jgi:hypothetical protein
VVSLTSSRERPLRPGDVVEVKSPGEILATLDGDALDNMPFMPEMIRHAGRRYTVTRRVDKICDTIAATGSRRMHDTVYLDDLRCDGSDHGGCQAGCKLYWKEAWLKRVESESGAVDSESACVGASDGADDLERVAEAGARVVAEAAEAQTDLEQVDGQRRERWRCQATEAFNASHQLKTSNLSQYWRELRNGNFGPLRFVRLLARAFVMELASRVGLLNPLPLHGPGPASEPAAANGAGPAKPLDIRPGELVRVRSPEEIAATLDDEGLNRGLSFDREMLPYCERTVRVMDRVQRIIDDRTGRMLKIPKDCLILEGAVCSGERSAGRWFCPRQIHSFWREAWVSRVDAAGATESENGHCSRPGEQSKERIPES